MADTKISALSSIASIADEDLLYITDGSVDGDRQITVGDLADDLDPLFLHHAETPDGDDDEFVTDTSGSYTAVVGGGTASWTFGQRDGTVVTFSGVTANTLNAQAKAATIAVGESVEIAASILCDNATARTTAAVFLADGTTSTDNLAGVEIANQGSSYGNLRYINTTYDGLTYPDSKTLATISIPGPLRARLRRTDTTKYQAEISLDGAVWDTLLLNELTDTTAFTHIGVGCQCEDLNAMVRFEYLRVT